MLICTDSLLRQWAPPASLRGGTHHRLLLRALCATSGNVCPVSASTIRWSPHVVNHCARSRRPLRPLPYRGETSCCLPISLASSDGQWCSSPHHAYPNTHPERRPLGRFLAHCTRLELVLQRAPELWDRKCDVQPYPPSPDRLVQSCVATDDASTTRWRAGGGRCRGGGQWPQHWLKIFTDTIAHGLGDTLHWTFFPFFVTHCSHVVSIDLELL